MKFVLTLRLATGCETAQLCKVTCCIQNDRSSISGLIEYLPLFHVKPKSASSQLLMLDFFCQDAEQWLPMALKLSQAVLEFCLLVYIFVGRNSAVDTETCYGLDSLGIESHPDKSWALQASYTKVIGSFTRIERQGRVVNNPPKSNVEIKERVQLYLSSSNVPSWRTFLYIFDIGYLSENNFVFCIISSLSSTLHINVTVKIGIEYLFGSY